jgi:hypothetical protein
MPLSSLVVMLQIYLSRLKLNRLLNSSLIAIGVE